MRTPSLMSQRPTVAWNRSGRLGGLKAQEGSEHVVCLVMGFRDERLGFGLPGGSEYARVCTKSCPWIEAWV